MLRSSPRSHRAGPWVRAGGGVLVLGVLTWWVGIGPFLDGVRVVDPPAMLVALAVGLVTTLCCAWRWRRVAEGLGVDLPLRDAIGAYYKSQFLNSTLPSGVVGDVHRAVRHGRDIGDVRLGVRAVVLERSASLVTQIALSVALLLFVFPTPPFPTPPFPTPPFPLPPMPAGPLPTALVVGVLVAAIPAGIALLSRTGSGRWARAVRAVGSDVRRSVFAGGRWLVVLASSGIALAGHLLVFVVAARAVGVTAPSAELLGLTLLALLAMALPISFAGWGPREGVAAWAFAAAGLGATQGVSTAVAYGALALVSTLPGGVILAGTWLGAGRSGVTDRAIPAFPSGWGS